MRACPGHDSWVTLSHARAKGRVSDAPKLAIGPPGLLGVWRRANDPAPYKSLVEKAQETAGQTTLRRHCNLKRTNEIRRFTWNTNQELMVRW
jgi:hypothetical protein